MWTRTVNHPIAGCFCWITPFFLHHNVDSVTKWHISSLKAVQSTILPLCHKPQRGRQHQVFWFQALELTTRITFTCDRRASPYLTRTPSSREEHVRYASCVLTRAGNMTANRVSPSRVVPLKMISLHFFLRGKQWSEREVYREGEDTRLHPPVRDRFCFSCNPRPELGQVTWGLCSNTDAGKSLCWVNSVEPPLTIARSTRWVEEQKAVS